MIYRPIKSTHSSKGSMEGLKGGRSTHVMFNGSGYLNPRYQHTSNLKPLARPDSMRYLSMSKRINGRMADYTQYKNMCPLDSRLSNLF